MPARKHPRNTSSRSAARAATTASTRSAAPRRKRRHAKPAGPTAKPGTTVPGTKQANIIVMLRRPEGASLAELVAATGWQAHSVRGAISGTLKRKLRLPVTVTTVDDRGRVYRLTSER